MITQITNSEELSEISGGRIFSFSQDFSQTGNNTSETVASASGDDANTSATANSSENGVSGSSSSSASSGNGSFSGFGGFFG